MPEGRSPPIGRLRNFAAVFEWTDEPRAADANVVPTYRRVGACWCSIKTRAEMTIGAAQIMEQSGPRGTHTIRTRFRTDLTTRHTLEIGDRRYRIVSVANDDARRFTELEAELYGDAATIGTTPPVLPFGLEA